MTLEDIKQHLLKLLEDTGLKERALVWKQFDCPTLAQVRESGRNVIIFLDNKELVDQTELSK
jgi:hypothetical protein